MTSHFHLSLSPILMHTGTKTRPSSLTDWSLLQFLAKIAAKRCMLVGATLNPFPHFIQIQHDKTVWVLAIPRQTVLAFLNWKAGYVMNHDERTWAEVFEGEFQGERPKPSASMHTAYRPASTYPQYVAGMY